MKDEQKVFIRGVEGRGDEVMKMLTDLGAANYGHCEGEYSNTLYYINHDGFVDHTLPSTETGQIIMDNYTELHLPEKWKDGDVLVSGEGLFFVLKGDFQAGDKDATIGAYCCVSEHQVCLSGHIGQIDYPHLASPSEVEHFHELMHKYGKDWDAENKQLVDWQWKPEIHECYFFVNSDLSVLSTPNDGPLIDLDAARIRRGNCFRTQREAKKWRRKSRNY